MNRVLFLISIFSASVAFNACGTTSGSPQTTDVPERTAQAFNPATSSGQSAGEGRSANLRISPSGAFANPGGTARSEANPVEASVTKNGTSTASGPVQKAFDLGIAASLATDALIKLSSEDPILRTLIAEMDLILAQDTESRDSARLDELRSLAAERQDALFKAHQKAGGDLSSLQTIISTNFIGRYITGQEDKGASAEDAETAKILPNVIEQARK